MELTEAISCFPVKGVWFAKKMSRAQSIISYYDFLLAELFSFPLTSVCRAEKSHSCTTLSSIWPVERTVFSVKLILDTEEVYNPC